MKQHVGVMNELSKHKPQKLKCDVTSPVKQNLGHGAHASSKPMVCIKHGNGRHELDLHLKKNNLFSTMEENAMYGILNHLQKMICFGYCPKRPYIAFYFIFQNNFFFVSNENLGHGAHASSKSMMLIMHGGHDPDLHVTEE